ncbi:hypothetical protein J4558_08845 [Leptolyngbya sp. 15MV]|nr:hypothetical protein J4558_08845 [Leptolyngbya sp. 15MV]
MFLRIILAILLPPVSILLCGRPVQAFFNFLLCIGAIFSAGITLAPAIIWALLVVIFWRQDAANQRLLRQLGKA